MKIWLNDLKEGDIFYHIVLHNVVKCRHLGDAHNINFRMPRIKYIILNSDLDYEYEEFVNQYVYDNEEEAKENLKENLKAELQIIQSNIQKTYSKLQELQKSELKIKKLLGYESNS